MGSILESFDCNEKGKARNLLKDND